MRERARGLAIPATQFTKEAVDYQSGSAEMQTNSLFEPKFREWIIGKVIAEGEVLKSDAAHAGAEEVECAVNTARNYLLKLTSSSGVFYEAKNAFGQVVLRLKKKE